ncbi:SURF1 family protein [Pseudoduganella armeniaca]|uniref:SURF1-like protein n=1 Tax=Pseudoduganella armeniaca TaxID=2072590 RepID=A0A2R4C795_9BURK|nr:SURF1 family protein [Pseudoduganella armeniaca]AVR95489.1 cytochrome oxidase biosynthesis protein [Pseudoduganella armeniaca]
MRIAFRFKLVPFIATVVLVALGIALGQWQTRRAEQKLALQAKLAAANAQAPLRLDGALLTPEQAEWRRVAVRGTFVANWPVYLDNRPHGGQAGFYVAMPLRIEGSNRHVLVLRGWLPVDAARRQRIMPYATPAGPVTIEGIARRDAGHVLQLGDAVPPAPGAIVQNAEVAQVAAASGLQLLPFVIQQTSGGTDGLVRDWPSPELGVDKHRGYAFQWYALALTALLFYIITGFISGRKQNR